MNVKLVSLTKSVVEGVDLSAEEIKKIFIENFPNISKALKL